MANTGILRYKDTKVVWTVDDGRYDAFMERVLADKGILEAPDCLGLINEREYCGSGNPLVIRWNGDRYSTTAPSSATINLVIQNDEDRAHLEPIFNGGYTVMVYRHGRVFWRGQVTPSLHIEAYKHYPYYLSLNCNDGIKESEKRQFLMIDFPNPWPVKISVLEFIAIYINTNLYPRGIFGLNVASRINHNGIESALEDIFIDPRVFMENDTDEYLSFDKVIESVLGPLNLQLLQWSGIWWLLALDAQWDAGKISYTKYGVAKHTLHKEGSFVDDLRILDLYGRSKTDREVEANAQIEYLQPWQSVTIKQDFQINTNILPFANRTGSFYYGHENKQLEFKEGPFVVPPAKNNLRHWTGDALTAPRPGNSVGADVAPYKMNAGALWMRSLEETGDPTGQAAMTFRYDLPDDMEFSRFTFTLNTLPTYKGVLNATDGKFKFKKWIEIRYTRKSGGAYYFWNRWDESDK